MISWPSKAKKAISVFFVKWNDVDIYVEDTARTSKSVYAALLNNALGEKCKVSTVFPLGDKKRVIAACTADQVNGGRPRLYLIDGDLDLISDVPPPSLKRLHSHQVYAFENYLFCENALIELLHEENSHLTIDQVRQTFDLSGFLTELAPVLELFVLFALTWIVDPSLPTVSLGVGRFLNATKTGIDATNVTAFCLARENELLKSCTRKRLTQLETTVRKRVLSFPNPHDLIAAREFLFPLFQLRRSARGLKLSASKDAIQMRLAKTCDLARHKGLLKALEDVAVA